jgi:hypothetical protein
MPLPQIAIVTSTNLGAPMPTYSKRPCWVVHVAAGTNTTRAVSTSFAANQYHFSAQELGRR